MSKKGWTDEENAILNELTISARNGGGSLSQAFRTAARMTGRQPDSVRNRYYAMLRESGCGARSFKPFSPEEAAALNKEMTRLIAGGMSVRGAALELAKGDAKLMLRFQNKYRSMTRAEREAALPLPAVKEDLPDTGRYAERIAELNDSLMAQHRRFMALHAMFTELCGINRELSRRLAAAGESESSPSPASADSV